MNEDEKPRREETVQQRTAGTGVGQGNVQRGIDTVSIHQAIGFAIHHHAAGDFHKAENICQEILHVEPNQPVALHLLGVISHQVGKNELAVTLIRQALFHKPDYIEAHNNLAIVLRQMGQLDDAVSSYRDALAVRPDYAEVHFNLGVTLQNLNRFEEAVASYRDALSFVPGFAEAHNNLGTTLRSMGRLDEALASYRGALAIRPDYAEAHYNLGMTYRDLGRLDDAVASYREALSLRPGFVEAYNNLGGVLRDLGRLDEAAESYGNALAVQNDSAETHNNLGVTLKELDKLEEAVASYHRALAIRPDYPDALNNLGTTLRYQGRAEEAFECHRRAVSLDPGNDLYWAGLAQTLENLSFTSIDDGLFLDLIRLIERPTMRPSVLVRPVLSALQNHPDFSQIAEQTGSGAPGIVVAFWDVAARLSEISLFLMIMGLAPLNNLRIERMLTLLRHAMLMQIVAGNTDEKGLPFVLALALQCFTNEYVFAETDEEHVAVEDLQRQIAMMLETNCDLSPFLVAALGSYRPLHMFPWVAKLLDRRWDGTFGEVIDRQISEPLAERALRSQVPCLTPIEETVSRTVRAQYEENPFPRWVRTDISGRARPVAEILRGPPLYLELGDYKSPESPEILVAGCGTGQQALGTASRYLNARVFAVDLSMSSLSYALRKTRELGFSNIEYAQADIMELGDLDQRFDIIECIGVLHHLGDPLAGWKILANLLRPGGLMLIGLYSEVARRDIVSGRAMIAERGYTPSPEDIRRCRRDIIAMAEDGNPHMAQLCATRDFFNLSNCRDMLFHVQEHRFTLPLIEQSLNDLGLTFLGFDIRDQNTLRNFRTSFPEKLDLTSFSRWHAFEQENPHTFRGMYQFWCKKV